MALAITITVLVSAVVVNTMFSYYSDKYTYSIMRQVPFTDGGVSHPWYIAPLKGYQVQLYNGSTYTVNSDYWDSCEHNPQQGHLIGIGFTNKTAYDERVILDQNVTTRDYIATFKTIAWVNATMVKCVIIQAW